MDPELLQLFLGAKKGNKNVSGVLGNMDNPLLAYLAGAYDPIAAGDAGGGGGSLWSKYEGYDEPAIQDVMAQIRNGVDRHYLSSYIDNKISDEDIAASGFQPEDFKALASDLQKDYSKSSEVNDMWSKAGLRNPLDEYSESDVPLTPEISDFISTVRKNAPAASSQYSRASSDVRNAERGLALKDEEMKKLMKALAFQQRRGGGNIPAQKITALMEKISRLPKGQYTRADIEQLVEEGTPNTGYERYDDQYRSYVDEAIKDIGGFQAPEMAQDEYRAAKERQGLAEQQMNANTELEKAARRGAAQAYRAAGRTPTRDQLAGIMKFLSSK